MEIILNGKKEFIEPDTRVLALLEERKIRPEIVTVELNESILDKSKYSQTRLKEKDKIEFVYYMGGGEYAV